MPNENETKVVEKTEDIVDDAIDLESEITLGEDASDDEKDKAIKTLQAQKDHWRKKATQGTDTKKEDPKKEQAKTSELTTADLYTLMRNNVPEEDVQDVVDFAKLKGISLAEALASDVVKTILETKEEQRTVAKATNIGKTAKTNTAMSDEELLSNAKKGIMPDSDEDMDRLARLRMGKK